MASFYGLPCISSTGGNTGIEKCIDANDFPVYGDIFVPDGMTFSLKDISAIVAQLQAAAIDPDRSKRIFPIFGYQEMEDRSEERQRAQKGYGAYFHTRDGVKSERYVIVGQSCLNKAAVAFRNAFSAYNRIMVFADGSLGATSKVSTTGETVYGGFTLSELYPNEYKQADGTNPAQWSIDLTHAILSEWDNRVLIKPSNGNVLTDLKGLKDISFDFYPQTPVVPGEYNLALTSGCGRVNISQIYSTELAAIALWKPKTYPGGLPVAVSSVTTSPQGLSVVELDITDVNYIAATKFKFELTDTTALATAGMVGYESGSIIVPK